MQSSNQAINQSRLPWGSKRKERGFSSFAFAGRGQCEQSKPKGGVEKFAPLRPLVAARSSEC